MTFQPPTDEEIESAFDQGKVAVVDLLHKVVDAEIETVYDQGRDAVVAFFHKVAARVNEPTEDQPFTNSIGMQFVPIPAGEFMMGSPDSDSTAFDEEKPAHQVTISQPFYLGKYPVTQAQWEELMGTSPSNFRGPELPVETVSWDDAQAFMKKLNEKEGVSSYRLPTEAQWEYTCRAGSSTIYYFGNEVAQLGEYAWYDDNSDSQTHPVGQKKPNKWGLYDMHGNVLEWVEDWYSDYSADAVMDPAGPDTGADRVIRGGFWDVSAQFVRAAYRFAVGPGDRYSNFGFRCLSSGRKPGSGA